MVAPTSVDPDALCSWVTRTRGDVPPALVGASLAAYTPPSGPSQTWLFGGRLVEGRDMQDEVYVLKGRTWTRLAKREGELRPSPRYFHSAHIWRDNLIVHGGMGWIADDNGGYSSTELEVKNDTFMFNFASASWRTIQPAPFGFEPTHRYAHVGTVAGDQLVLIGGQDKDVEYIQEMEVLDLVKEEWVGKESMADNREQRGSYRTTCCADEAGNVVLYSNFNFTDVRRVFEVIKTSPKFQLADQSEEMMEAETLAAPAPQGLRFPSAFRTGDWLVWSGVYIAANMQEYCVWALNLVSLQWVSLDLGHAPTLREGSWNRGLLDSSTNHFKVFGNENGNMLDDYGKRATNFTHFATLDLEAFGIYAAPPPQLSLLAMKLALQSYDNGLGNDFEIICEDNRKVSCSRSLLERRWPWLAAQRKEFTDLARARSFEPGQDPAGNKLPTALLRNAQLHFPTECFPVVVALVQYFYVLDLVTPVQLAPPVLSSLLVLAKQYNVPDLERRVIHQMHQKLSLQTADSIISVAGISGAKSLMVRAMRLKHVENGGRINGYSRPGSGQTGSTGNSGGGSGGQDGGEGRGGGGHPMTKSRSTAGDNRPRASSAMDRQNSYARDAFVFPAPPISPVHSTSPSYPRRGSAPTSPHSSLNSQHSSFSTDLDTPRASALGPRTRTISEGTARPALPLPTRLTHNAVSRSRASSLSSSHKTAPSVSSPLSPNSPHVASVEMDRAGLSWSSQASTVESAESAVPDTPTDFGSPRSRSSMGMGKGQFRHRSSLSIASSTEDDDDVFSHSRLARGNSISQQAIPEYPAHSSTTAEQTPAVLPRGLAISSDVGESLAALDLFHTNAHLSLSLRALDQDDVGRSQPAGGQSTSTVQEPASHKRIGTADIMALATSRAPSHPASVSSASLAPSQKSKTSPILQGLASIPMSPSKSFQTHPKKLGGTWGYVPAPPPVSLPPAALSNAQAPPASSSAPSYTPSTSRKTSAYTSRTTAEKKETSKVFAFGRGAASAKTAVHTREAPAFLNVRPSPPPPTSAVPPSPTRASTTSSGYSTEGKTVMYGRGGAGRTIQPKVKAEPSQAERVRDKSLGKEKKSFMGIKWD